MHYIFRLLLPMLLSVSLSVTWLYSALVCKTAERIEVLFEVKNLGAPRDVVSDGVAIPHGECKRGHI